MFFFQQWQGNTSSIEQTQKFFFFNKVNKPHIYKKRDETKKNKVKQRHQTKVQQQ